MLDMQQRKSNIIGAPARVDAGLKAYILRVYNYMSAGLIISAIAAFFASKPPLVQLLFQVKNQSLMPTGLGWIVMFLPFLFIFLIGSSASKVQPQKAGWMFWVFAGLMGLSLGNIFLIYSGESIGQTFIICAGVFGAMSLYGYTTQRDLTGMGSFLMMGLFGLIIAMIVNWFMKSPAIYYMISVIGVGIFTGLAAYDTQKIKAMYVETDSQDIQKSKAVIGALTLYLDFINLFLMLLRLMGNNRR